MEKKRKSGCSKIEQEAMRLYPSLATYPTERCDHNLLQQGRREGFVRGASLNSIYGTAAEQARTSEWPTEAMIVAAELKMPNLGRLQIRFLFETMLAASSPNYGTDPTWPGPNAGEPER